MTESNQMKPSQENEKDGQFSYQAGKFEDAAKAYSRAKESYLHAGNKLKAAEMANNQAVALIQADQPEQALLAVEGTEKVFEEAGDELHYAMALGNKASILESLGKLHEALAIYTKSAGVLKNIGAQEDYAQIMKSVSALKLRLKNPLGALASMQDGLETVDNPNWKQRLVKRLLKIPFNFFGK